MEERLRVGKSATMVTCRHCPLVIGHRNQMFGNWLWVYGVFRARNFPQRGPMIGFLSTPHARAPYLFHRPKISQRFLRNDGLASQITSFPFFPFISFLSMFQIMLGLCLNSCALYGFP